MIFTISPTVSAHLPTIVKINQEAIPAVSSVTLKGMEHFLSTVDYFRTLQLDDIIIGFLIALTPGKDYHSPNYKWFEKKFDSFMYVDRIVIDPAYQSNGFGWAFYNNLKEFTEGRSPRITCEVNLRPPNEGSIIFHEKYGFRQVGRQETEKGKKEVSLMVYKINLS